MKVKVKVKMVERSSWVSERLRAGADVLVRY